MALIRHVGPQFPNLQSEDRHLLSLRSAAALLEWLARANGRRFRTIRRWRSSLPPDERALSDFLSDMTPELGRQMAMLRPPGGMLPLWSRMAIAQLAAEGATYKELMETFKVGRSTVYRAIHWHPLAYCQLSGRRLLTVAQSTQVIGNNGARVRL